LGEAIFLPLQFLYFIDLPIYRDESVAEGRWLPPKMWLSFAD